MTTALGRLAAGLALAAVVLRWGESAGVAGTGLNLFIHVLPLFALAAWLAARALAGGGPLRLTGAEIPLLAFMAVGFASTAVAAYVLPALETAFMFLSAGLFAILAVNGLGRRGLAELLLGGLAAASAYALAQYFIHYPAIMAAARDGAFGGNEEILRRVMARQPQAAFIGPNQLAAFVAATLPMAAGAAIDVRRGLGLALTAILTVAGLAALVLTGSLGACGALACGALAFGGMAVTRRRGRRAVVLAGAALGGLLVALAIFSPLLASLAGRSHSLHVRRVYWQSAARMIAERPVLGAGLGGFEEHYYRVKPDVQQETRHAHNDYLQLLAETGVIGLLAFGALLAAVLRVGLRREEDPAADLPPLPPWLLPASGVAACLLLFLAHAGDPVYIVLALIWAGVPLLLRKAAFEPGPFARIGAVAGLLALLVHMAVDFDLYDPGVAFALFALFAFVLAGRTAEVHVPRPAAAAGAVLLTLAALPLLVLCGPLIAAGRELETAPDAARRHNPLDADAAHAAALGQFRSGSPEAAAETIADALRLRPRRSPYHATAARIHLRLHEKHRAGASDLDRALAAEHLRQARAAQERAVDHYPSMSRQRYELARILDRLGEGDAALPHYEEALRLSSLASQEVENLRRLQLDRIQRVRALARLGRTEEARKEAKPLIPLGGEVDVRALLERIRSAPDVLPIPADELDDVTRPILRDVIDALLKSLPR